MSDVATIIGENPITSEVAGIVGGIALGVAADRAVSALTSNSTKHYRKSKKTNKKSSSSKRRRYTPHTAGKGKDRSHRRIRYTSKGQPYIITGNGRAKFISMKSAHSSQKRRGGKY